jgi:hypothetical protein
MSRLEELNFSFTDLKTITNYLPAIITLKCNDNENLETLPVLGFHLKSLDCHNCPKLKNLPLLTPNIEELVFDEDKVETIANIPITSFGTPFLLENYKKVITSIIHDFKADDFNDEEKIFNYIILCDVV